MSEYRCLCCVGVQDDTAASQARLNAKYPYLKVGEWETKWVHKGCPYFGVKFELCPRCEKEATLRYPMEPIKVRRVHFFEEDTKLTKRYYQDKLGGLYREY